MFGASAGSLWSPRPGPGLHVASSGVYRSEARLNWRYLWLANVVIRERGIESATGTMRKVATKIRKKGASWARHGKHKHRWEVVRWHNAQRQFRHNQRMLQNFCGDIRTLLGIAQ